jgi:hypothetical protein
MNNLKFVLVLLMFFQICNNSVGQSNSKDNSAHSDFNILFIGNSLTYTNNLPELVRNSAQQKGIIIDTKMIAYPNYAIIDHWNDGQVQEEIASRRYNYIIIQQGPSSQPYGKEILIEYGKKYSALCKNNNAQLSYLMVWPSLTYYDTFAGVIKNHQDAASINDAILCPVGQVWKEYFDSTNNFDYYSPDGFHPSLKGSQVAADVIVEYLFQQ